MMRGRYEGSNNSVTRYSVTRLLVTRLLGYSVTRLLVTRYSVTRYSVTWLLGFRINSERSEQNHANAVSKITGAQRTESPYFPYLYSPSKPVNNE